MALSIPSDTPQIRVALNSFQPTLGSLAARAGSHAHFGDMEVPTVLRQGQWRFFFYSNEGSEPPHIHVASAAGHSRGTAKFLLMPVRMVRSRGLSAHELRGIGRFVVEREEDFVRAWNEHFSAD